MASQGEKTIPLRHSMLSIHETPQSYLVAICCIHLVMPLNLLYNTLNILAKLTFIYAWVLNLIGIIIINESLHRIQSYLIYTMYIYCYHRSPVEK